MVCIGLRDDTVSFLIGGEAGQGIMRSGFLLGRALMRGGLHIFGANDYPSLIRGGHNFYILRASETEVHSQGDGVDLLIALDDETVRLHIHEVYGGGAVIYDEESRLKPEDLRGGVRACPTPLTGVVEEMGGPRVVRNTVALGVALSLVGFDLEPMRGVIRDAFRGRERIIEMNLRAVERGYEYAEDNFEALEVRVEPSRSPKARIMVTGNEAVALGAIGAGCRFYAAYPMTPATPILHYLAAHDEEAGMVVLQAESEIAAINMVVGAAYAGVRAMTATSGGGFCLMTEALGLAAMTETPLVLVLNQRPGPSTGMATYTSQGDLLFTLHASQGEFPRVVVAPGDVDECFYLTMEAFNLAERYQVPVIILADKYLAESHKSTSPFDPSRVAVDRGDLLTEWPGEEEYRRYRLTESGISPRILPGVGGATMLANTNEHDEYGYATTEPEMVKAMMDKRFRKLEALRGEIEGLNPVRVYGEEEAEVSIVGWGSTKGPALEALKLLRRGGIEARFIQPVYLEPFPRGAMERLLSGDEPKLLVEMNKTAQLGSLIGLHIGYVFKHRLLRYDGRPVNPGEIYEAVKEVLG
ncbi:MAG: 2-oxoacid:acceptor oxidoreductase, alpha subunit [Candidatus Bathyarchaeota archaeon B23]|nr:MAG: 2-oxoacid:acceptor oxidoreductase, alpha subunit [Candidatus Bathyarchaeota archaeon B23]